MVATRRLEALSSSIAQRLDLPTGPWMVALSGGADSAALAWFAARLGKARAVHVHHGWPASDRLQAAALGVAEALKMTVEVARVDLDRVSETAARTARYEALDRRLRPSEWILTAHTLDDQAETVLANLLRGSGLDGLAGIPARRGRIARPLLDVSRSETRELAALASLPWIDDPYNLDPTPLRNRIRLALIPQLEEQFNPGLRRHLASAARAVAGLAVMAPDPGEMSENGWRAPAGVLWALGEQKAIDLLRRAVRALRLDYGLDRAEARRVWSVVAGDATATELRGRLRVERDGPWITITRSAGARLD
ncbi:MAG: tRNA lysidine(34) synthetase TilS [Acidimicrobiia bacterium]